MKYSMVLIGMIGLISSLTATPVEFVIIIPSFNNENYYEENLNSACYQISASPYEVIYINDCSSDKTGPLVDRYVKEHKLEHKVKVIHNQERVGSGLANIYNAIHKYVEDHKVVVILDGDDYFPHLEVLSILETYYQNPDVWMTHSVQKYIPTEAFDGIPVPQWIYKEGKIRDTEWVCMTALRTFRAALFKKVNEGDLYYQGKFMTVSWDVAFCIPMIEMCATPCTCGDSHYVFIDEVLYHYRINTPYNDYRTRKKLQKEVDDYIRQLNPYKPLSSL